VPSSRPRRLSRLTRGRLQRQTERHALGVGQGEQVRVVPESANLASPSLGPSLGSSRFRGLGLVPALTVVVCLTGPLGLAGLAGLARVVNRVLRVTRGRKSVVFVLGCRVRRRIGPPRLQERLFRVVGAIRMCKAMRVAQARRAGRVGSASSRVLCVGCGGAGIWPSGGVGVDPGGTKGVDTRWREKEEQLRVGHFCEGCRGWAGRAAPGRGGVVRRLRGGER
jgi:hypothetical protein